MNYPHKLFRWVGDLVFPYRCLGCDVYLDKSYLCTKCFNTLPVRHELECIGCRRSTPGGKTCPFCQESCALDRLYIVSDFKDPVLSGAIKAMKYRFLPALIDPLVRLARKYIQDLAQRKHISFVAEEFLVVPVPLHTRRENWRGFNQAALLAETLAPAYQLEVAHALRRTSHTIPQADIEDRESRLKNVVGAYMLAMPQKVLNRNILLIDDVCTTGATLNECARVLKNAGAGSVAALVIARG